MSQRNRVKREWIAAFVSASMFLVGACGGATAPASQQAGAQPERAGWSVEVCTVTGLTVGETELPEACYVSERAKPLPSSDLVTVGIVPRPVRVAEGKEVEVEIQYLNVSKDVVQLDYELTSTAGPPFEVRIYDYDGARVDSSSRKAPTAATTGKRTLRVALAPQSVAKSKISVVAAKLDPARPGETIPLMAGSYQLEIWTIHGSVRKRATSATLSVFRERD